MRAAAFRAPGPPDVFEMVELPTPVPGPEECLVHVTATALNRADLLRRSGAIPPSADLTVLGVEFSGVVGDVGGAVQDFAPGDKVIGRVPAGAYAEALVTHERMLMPAPSSVPLVDAASIPLVWMTAYDALVIRCHLTTAENVLIHAGASGVGTAAIQLARAWHAFVLATTSGHKVDACKSIGAHHAIARDSEDFAERALELTEGRGCDVILDVVGGSYLSKNVDALAPRGRLAVVGLLDAGPAALPLQKLLAKGAQVTATNLGMGRNEERAALTQRLCREVLPLFDQGRIRTVVDSRFTLDRVGDAHAYLESNANVGKVVIEVNP